MAQRGYDLQTLGPNVGIICRHGGSGVEHLPKIVAEVDRHMGKREG